MQAADQVLRFAGDVSIDKCKITTSGGVSQDIAAQVIAISIYEDLFSPFITGSLILKESFDLVNIFPFVGEEMVEIEISTPTLKDGNIKGSFYVYKLTDRELVGDKNVVYQLHFISMEAIVDLNKKVSKVFTGNPDELVKTIVKDNFNGLQSKKEVFAEPTSKAVKFISNFWSPIKCINFITERAVNRNKSPSYVFFENRYGFYFVSLESLYANGNYQEFTYDNYTRTPLPNGDDAKNVKEDYRRINTINIPVGYDYIDRIRSGMFSSKMTSYDLNKKIYNVKNYSVKDNFASYNHLNKNPLTGDNVIFRSNSLLINYPRNNGNLSGFGDSTNYRNLQERISLMKLAEANKIEIVVPGRCDYTVGQKVSVTLNKIEPASKKDNDEELVDKMFSGFYLIGAINHYITRERHECSMELIKDSLQMNIDGKK
jgi:hypothetical protein